MPLRWRSRKRSRHAQRFRRLRDANWRRGWRIARRGMLAVGLATLLFGASLGMAYLDDHVERILLSRADRPDVVFVNLSPDVDALAREDLVAGIADLRSRKWTDDRLCRELALRIAGVPWVEKLDSVRRTGDGRFEVRAAYRVPAAMVRHGDRFFLVDGDAVRLPGVYVYDPQRMLILGVSEAPPPMGSVWPGEDLLAGLSIAGMVASEPYGEQIRAVVVENFAGRMDFHRCHVELVTDRPGGRILWGSAPGREVEENSVAQKLGILRANFRDTGRADAGHDRIDVSTFADRFTIP